MILPYPTGMLATYALNEFRLELAGEARECCEIAVPSTLERPLFVVFDEHDLAQPRLLPLRAWLLKATCPTFLPKCELLHTNARSLDCILISKRSNERQSSRERRSH